MSAVDGVNPEVVVNAAPAGEVRARRDDNAGWCCTEVVVTYDAVRVE